MTKTKATNPTDAATDDKQVAGSVAGQADSGDTGSPGQSEDGAGSSEQSGAMPSPEALPPGSYTQEQLDAAIADATAGLFTQEQVDEKVKAAVDAALKKAAARREKAAKKAATARHFDVTDAGLPDDLADDIHVAFADEDGDELDGITPLTFFRDQFERDQSGASLVLNRVIEFPVHGPGAELRRVFLIDDEGRAYAQARLHAPLLIGSGRSAIIPAGHLRFA